MSPQSRPASAFDAVAHVRSSLAESARVKLALAEQHALRIVQAAELITDCFRRGGKALLFGNGGSAADAQHLAAEFTGRLRRERQALSAIALATNPSDVTALGNDYGFEAIFARLIEAHGRTGDVAIAFSTSGNSPNVLAALREARQRGLRSVGLSGRGGGKLEPLVDVAIVVPSDDTQRIQESHITIAHTLAELVEEALFPTSA